jgi:hypothetical protein
MTGLKKAPRKAKRCPGNGVLSNSFARSNVMTGCFGTIGGIGRCGMSCGFGVNGLPGDFVAIIVFKPDLTESLHSFPANSCSVHSGNKFVPTLKLPLLGMG